MPTRSSDPERLAGDSGFGRQGTGGETPPDTPTFQKGRRQRTLFPRPPWTDPARRGLSDAVFTAPMISAAGRLPGSGIGSRAHAGRPARLRAPGFRRTSPTATEPGPGGNRSGHDRYDEPGHAQGSSRYPQPLRPGRRGRRRWPGRRGPTRVFQPPGNRPGPGRDRAGRGDRRFPAGGPTRGPWGRHGRQHPATGAFTRDLLATDAARCARGRAPRPVPQTAFARSAPRCGRRPWSGRSSTPRGAWARSGSRRTRRSAARSH